MCIMWAVPGMQLRAAHGMSAFAFASASASTEVESIFIWFANACVSVVNKHEGPDATRQCRLWQFTSTAAAHTCAPHMSVGPGACKTESILELLRSKFAACSIAAAMHTLG